MKSIWMSFITYLTWPTTAFAQWNYGWHMRNWHYMWGGIFMWILLLILIGVIVYLLAQQKKEKNTEGILQESALDILKKRYAKGEITREQFDQMKNDVES
ncbi:MAG: SHOCT domain-containing protein [bacterium]